MCMAAAKGAKRRDEPQRDRPLKEDSIRIRVTAEQKDKLVARATRAGMGVSTWMLMVALREAEAGDRGAGQ